MTVSATDKKTEYQLDSKMCSILIEARVEGSWECKPFIDWLYGSESKIPDCSTCDIVQEYMMVGQKEEKEKGNKKK